MVAIAAVVIAGNLLYVLGVVVANPLAVRSGLGSGQGVLFGASTIDPNDAFISQALTHRAMLDWVHFSLPWWDPYQGTGMPLAGEMQSAAFFPPSALALLSDGQLYERMLLEFLSGAWTFLLLRRIEVGVVAATAGGIAFALSGTFAWFAHAAINPIAFLPLLLLGIESARSAAVAGRRGGWWVIAVACALSFYAGFPETAYPDALLAVAWLVWRCASAPRSTVSSCCARWSRAA